MQKAQRKAQTERRRRRERRQLVVSRKASKWPALNYLVYLSSRTAVVRNSRSAQSRRRNSQSRRGCSYRKIARNIISWNSRSAQSGRWCPYRKIARNIIPCRKKDNSTVSWSRQTGRRSSDWNCSRTIVRLRIRDNRVQREHPQNLDQSTYTSSKVESLITHRLSCCFHVEPKQALRYNQLVICGTVNAETSTILIWFSIFCSLDSQPEDYLLLFAFRTTGSYSSMSKLWRVRCIQQHCSFYLIQCIRIPSKPLSNQNRNE